MPATLDKLQITWTLRSPGGWHVDTMRLPNHVECSVCGVPALLEGVSGRVVCGHCGAHVVTVLIRSSVDA